MATTDSWLQQHMVLFEGRDINLPSDQLSTTRRRGRGGTAVQLNTETSNIIFINDSCYVTCHILNQM
jgi:hypothetical protein